MSLEKNMTVTGFILGGAFSELPPAVEKQLMAMDFAKKVLLDSKIRGIEIADSGSLRDRMQQQLNDTEACAFMIIASDAMFPKSAFSALDFSAPENYRFVSQTGDFLGAFLRVPMEYADILALDSIKTVNGVRITAQNFHNIMSERKKSVYKSLCENNVFVEDIDNVTISPLATIGSGSFVGCGVRILGESKIGRNCSLTGVCSINQSELGDDCTIESAVITDSVIGNNVTVGPFAYVRPSSKIADRVKVGDFVEVKNSQIGEGTKISHLTYVGDSDVGAGVNFGCGTVTVNYDGIHKHRTIIGDNAFIGCNTNLVAPVSVGENAFIAAGSTITDAIPDKSFTIARQKQTTKPGYVTEKMPDMIKNK